MKIDLKKLNLSEDCVKYFNSKPDFETAWRECPRGEWMIEIVVKIGVEKKLIIMAALEYVETVRRLMKDPRSTNALDKTMAYCKGEITIEELRTVRDEAFEVVSSTDCTTFNHVTYGSNYAAYAISGLDAVNAIYASIDAATYDSYGTASYDPADAYAVYAAVMQKNQLQIADICLERLTPVVLDKIKKLEIN